MKAKDYALLRDAIHILNAEGYKSYYGDECITFWKAEQVLKDTCKCISIRKDEDDE